MKSIVRFSDMAWLICMVLLSCQKGAGNTNVTAKKNAVSTTPLMTSKAASEQGWQPEGSKIERIGSTLQVTAPKGWGYVGYDSIGNLFNLTTMPKKSISCNCNNSPFECRPLEASLPLGGGSISSCSCQDNNCTMKRSFSLENREYMVSSGGYYAMSGNTTLLRDGEAAPAVFDALLELDAFKDELRRFYDEAYEGSPVQPPIISRSGTVTAPKGYSLVALSILGRGMLVVVPEAYAGSRLGYIPLARASCSCEEGSCTIKDKTIAGMGLIYCQGHSTSCSLGTTSPGPNLAPYMIKLPSLQY